MRSAVCPAGTRFRWGPAPVSGVRVVVAVRATSFPRELMLEENEYVRWMRGGVESLRTWVDLGCRKIGYVSLTSRLEDNKEEDKV